MLPDKYQGSVVSFRNDRMGARFLSLLNAIRIGADYDMPYFFTWMTHGRASEELQAPTEIFDAAYFDAHFVSHDDFRLLDGTAVDFATLPLTTEASLIPDGKAKGDAFICMGTELVVLPWENAEDVAPRYAAAIDELVFSKPVQDAMKAVDVTLAQSGTAFHIRRGDIIYDPVTSNQLWSNKYIPREFYEVLAKRLTSDPDHTVLVFSDEPAEITRLKEISPQIMAPDEVLPAGLTLAQRDFMEIYAMSRCQQIIGPPGSGFSAAAALIGNRPIRDITTVLDEAENAVALDLLTQRLTDRSPLFLSDGDTGQSLPFARNHLNATGRQKQALTLLESYQASGFNKLFFYKLLLEQRLISGQFNGYNAVLENLATAKLDQALPARLEQHWSELSRIASVLAANARDAEGTAHHAAMAFWYGGGNRTAYNTFSVLLAKGFITPATFALPFDPDVKRPVPAKLGPRPGSEGLDDQPTEAQWVIPPDLLVRDWQMFMGKTLNRGFDTPAAAARALELFNIQFARHSPPASAMSVQGVYATVLGQHTQALDLHKTALRAAPDNPLFLKRMAATMLAVDPQDPIARILLEKAATCGENQSLYKAELAQCLMVQGDMDRAISLMAEAARAEDALPEVPFLAARMMRQHKHITDDTLALIDLALARAPHVRRFMIMRVHILSDLGRRLEADTMLDDIVTRYGDGGDTKALRARLAA